jgi:hypothetical protein
MFLLISLCLLTNVVVATTPITIVLSRNSDPAAIIIFGAIGGAILFALSSIFNSNSNSKNKYLKNILKNPKVFKEKWLGVYKKELAESDVSEEDKISVEDFSKMIDSYIVYIQNGNKETLDVYMNRYFQTIK